MNVLKYVRLINFFKKYLFGIGYFILSELNYINSKLKKIYINNNNSHLWWDS